MRSFAAPLAVAAALPAALACLDPSTHDCPAAFVNSADVAASFCATFTASSVTDVSAVPTELANACDSNAKTYSSMCECFVTGGAAPAATTLATSAAAKPTSAAGPSVVVATSAISHKAASTSSVKKASSTVAGKTSAVSSSVAQATAAVVASGSGTAITSLAGGAGVGGTTCTVTDMADATAAVSTCSNVLLDGITISASSTLSLTVPSGGALLFAGTATVEYTPDSDYTPIVFKGDNAIIAGLAGAVIDGQGAKYWDGEGSNGGTDKPDHFIKLSDMTSSTFEELTIQNWPTHLFEITGCTDMTMKNLILDNSAGDAEDSDGDALGHNTDAFDVSTVDGLYVSGATVYNQDDCVAFNSGSNAVFENMYCSGGHGLSIGSISSDVTVSNVTFQDSTVVDSENGCRIKTDADGTDSTVSDITYSGITVSGITDYAIDLQQDYENGSPTGDPSSDIVVSSVTFTGISGTSSGYNYYVLCGSTDSCTDIVFEDIDITGGDTSCSPSSLCTSMD